MSGSGKFGNIVTSIPIPLSFSSDSDQFHWVVTSVHYVLVGVAQGFRRMMIFL